MNKDGECQQRSKGDAETHRYTQILLCCRCLPSLKSLAYVHCVFLILEYNVW